MENRQPFIEIHHSGDQDDFTTLVFVFPDPVEDERIAINKEKFFRMMELAKDVKM